MWRTPAYFIFDPETEKLEGFRLDAAERRYLPIEPDEHGDFDVAPLGLKLGLRPTVYRQYECRFVRWLTSDGVPLPTAQERAAGAEARTVGANAHAEREHARAEREHARAEELEARLKALEAKARNES